jgi:tetratricopeptide (TPR) repeat protein
MRIKPILLLIALQLLLAAALAQSRSVAVYPMASQDVMLGVAVSERIATSLEERFAVLGPAVTPALLPPLVLRDGFVNPVNLLARDAFAPRMSSRSEIMYLRESLGVDIAMGGQILYRDQLELELVVATPDQVRTIRVRALEDQPGLLARKALDVLAPFLGVALPREPIEIDLSSPYGDYVAAVALTGGGFLEDALASLESAVAEVDEPRWREMLDDLEATLEGRTGADPVLQAAVSLSVAPFTEALPIRYFRAVAEAPGAYPFVATWLGALYASAGNREAAVAAFDQAAESYPYGQAARAMFLAAQGEASAQLDIEELAASDQRAALLGAAVAAEVLGDLELERTLLANLTRAAPTLVYPFERLSFIAFDLDEPLAAVQALAVAVDLEPENDLYWTNLGWAYYLLGFLERSEEASLRAVDLAPEQFIAWYNLGLVRTVTGRLEEAMATYEHVLANVTEVDEEAVADLENALELYPNEAGVHFALATLYEAAGRREEAATQFERYVTRGQEERFLAEARQNVEVLRAPPAPIEISPGARLGLGPQLVQAEPYRPGDRLYATFELFTPGFELPSSVQVEYQVVREDGTPVDELAFTTPVRVPGDVVALRVDTTGVTLPTTLEPGAYEIRLRVTAGEREATAVLPFSVAGEPVLVRQLASRNVVLRELESGTPFYNVRQPTAISDEQLVSALLTELQGVADVAEEALPEVPGGRFEGLTGGAFFRQSSEEDVQDFLEFLLAQGTVDADYTFVDAYAQWVLDGAPAAEQ